MAREKKPQKPKAIEAKVDSPEDVVLLQSKTEDGAGVRVLRKRGDELSVGEIRPLEEGKPVHGDIVSLKQRPEHEALYDVTTEVSAHPKATKGPTKVSSDRYRKGWDSLWGKKRRPKTLN